MNELPRDQNSLLHRIEPETIGPRRSTRLLGQQLDYRFPGRPTLRSETGASGGMQSNFKVVVGLTHGIRRPQLPNLH